MYTLEMKTFVFSWRAFLMGPRRGWHAHYRITLQGHRKNNLVAHLENQLLCLTRGASLLVEVFSRGGRVWSFGLGSSWGEHPWGIHWNTWRPGVLSNHFMVRARRIHFNRLNRLVIRRRQRRPRRRRRQRRRSFTGGFDVLPDKEVYSGNLQGYYKGGFYERNDLSLTGHPWQGYLRSRWFRQGWSIPWVHLKLNQFYTSKTRFNRYRRRRLVARKISREWGPGMTNPINRVGPPSPLRRSRRLKRRRGRTRSGDKIRQRSRFVQTPIRGLPTLVVAGGFSLGTSGLVHEIPRLGNPLLYFGGVSFRMPPLGWKIPWGESSSLEGIQLWMENLFQWSSRTGLLKTLWGRLGC